WSGSAGSRCCRPPRHPGWCSRSRTGRPWRTRAVTVFWAGAPGSSPPGVDGGTGDGGPAGVADETGDDDWLPAALLLLLLVDPQAAARAPVHSRAAAALIRRAAWAEGLIGGSLVRRGC